MVPSCRQTCRVLFETRVCRLVTAHNVLVGRTPCPVSPPETAEADGDCGNRWMPRIPPVGIVRPIVRALLRRVSSVSPSTPDSVQLLAIWQ